MAENQEKYGPEIWIPLNLAQRRNGHNAAFPKKKIEKSGG